MKKKEILLKNFECNNIYNKVVTNFKTIKKKKKSRKVLGTWATLLINFRNKFSVIKNSL